MPRLTNVDPAKADGKVKELFDGPLKSLRINLFKALANSPAALNGYVAFAGALNRGVLTAAEREAIALTTAQLNGCAYCLAAHTALGMKAGLTAEQALGARRGQVADPRLDALSRFVAAIHERRGAVTDGELAAFRAAGFSDDAFAEVFAHYALNVFTNYFNIANGTEVDFPPPPPLS